MRVLIIWKHEEPENRMRKTIVDYVRSFERYDKNNEYHYLNLTCRLSLRLLEWIEEDTFDTIVFTCTFLGFRWSSEKKWISILDMCEATFGRLNCRKIIMPQDDYDNTSKLWDFINRVNVQEIYTIMSKVDYPILYPEIEIGVRKIETVLTGYIEYDDVNRVFPEKKIDVIYRANKLPYKFGRLGQYKSEIVKIFDGKLGDLVTDIRTTEGNKNVLKGDRWINGLATARCVLGCPSGSSIMDVDGRVGRSFDTFLSENPDASYDDAKAACFPELEENIHGMIGPRNFEAAITKTCQVLVEGDYSGILKPNIDYIPIDKDFCNVDDVIAKIHDRAYCEEIAEQCYKDVVEDGRYSYRTLVTKIIGEQYEGRSYRERQENRRLVAAKCAMINVVSMIYSVLLRCMVYPLLGVMRRLMNSCHRILTMIIIEGGELLK